MRFSNLLLATPLLLTGCLSGSYERFDVETPLDEVAVATLEPGVTDLTASLAALGAPLHVHQLHDGAVLAWGYRQAKGWDVMVDLPTGSVTDAPFSFSSVRGGLKGIVLFFDADWLLYKVERGWLADILPGERPRTPSLVE